jgi:hypothetical protein
MYIQGNRQNMYVRQGYMYNLEGKRYVTYTRQKYVYHVITSMHVRRYIYSRYVSNVVKGKSGDE